MAAVLKAMGVESDQEILALTGCTGDSAALLMPTLQECKGLQVFTSQQALEYLGGQTGQGSAALSATAVVCARNMLP